MHACTPLVYVCMCVRALRWCVCVCVCVAVLCIQNKSSKSKLSCKQAATPTPRRTRRPVERSAHSWPRCCTHRECESEIVLHRERQSRITKGRRKKETVYLFACLWLHLQFCSPRSPWKWQCQALAAPPPTLRPTRSPSSLPPFDRRHVHVCMCMCMYTNSNAYIALALAHTRCRYIACSSRHAAALLLRFRCVRDDGDGDVDQSNPA